MDASNSTATRICDKHGEYEARFFRIGERTLGGNCQKCDAERESAAKERKDQIAAADEKRRIEALVQRAAIPQRFQSRTFANYVASTDGQARALRVATAYAEGWAEVRERGTCLIFSGKAGTGKTHLACAIANFLLAKGVASLFTTVSDAMRAIKRSYDPGIALTETDALRAFVDPSLLIFDEVGGSKGTEHETQLMFDIINKRYESCRPTIVLTNLDPAALRDHLGERVTDRLREGGGKLIPFSWESHRS